MGFYEAPEGLEGFIKRPPPVNSCIFVRGDERIPC